MRGDIELMGGPLYSSPLGKSLIMSLVTREMQKISQTINNMENKNHERSHPAGEIGEGLSVKKRTEFANVIEFWKTHYNSDRDTTIEHKIISDNEVYNFFQTTEHFRGEDLNKFKSISGLIGVKSKTNKQQVKCYSVDRANK